MTRNKLFTALALVVAAFCVFPAHADLTIKVQKGGEAPYLYAYDNSGKKLLGEFPGEQYTDKDADGYWTKDVNNANGVNIVFSMGSNVNQTNDIKRIPGVDGVAKFMYDGKSTWFSVMPQLESTEGYIYFNCPPDWGNSSSSEDKFPYVYFLDSNNNQLGTNSWPGWRMSYVGVDGAGFEIYKFQTGTWSGISKLIFNNNSASGNNQQTGNLTYVANGYYNTEGSQAQVHALNSANGYTDENFRAGIAAQLGISDGSVFVPSKVTYLDVSGRQIESLAGISNFHNLQTLIAANNSLLNVDLSNNGEIEILNLNGNNRITSVDLSNQEGLTHLEMSSCNIDDNQTFAPQGKHTALTYLDISENPISKGFSWSTYLPNLETLKAANANLKPAGFTLQHFAGLTKLKYLDVSNCTQITTLYLTGKTALETLIINGITNLQDATEDVLPGLSNLTSLKHVEFNGVDLSTKNFIGSESDAGRLTASRSSLEYLDISNDNCFTPDVYGYTALKTLKIGGNDNITSLKINSCTALEEVDVTGNTAMTKLTLNNDGLSNSNIPTLTGLSSCTSLAALDLSYNAFTSVPSLVLPASCTSLYLNSNQLTGFEVPSGSSVQFLYAENNGFSGALELTSESVPTLKGLDLGNNEITSFKAEGTGLSALMLGNNPTMTTLELHGNNNLTCTTANEAMSDGSGLYLLGNTALETIDLSNSSFNQIGADAALEGLTNVKTLNGSHNKFTTFTNSNYDNGVRLASYVAGKSSLEHLTGLEHLDLSYNELADSVHLFRNTNLTWLDVSHNNVIGPLATTDAEKLAMRLKKADLLRKYHCKDTPIGVSCTAATQATLNANEALTHRAFDLRDIDLRDTTGLFHLDLNFNTQLKYLNISETNIHNTAAGWWYMDPGWEYGTGGWYSYVDPAHPGTKSPANGSTRHHFVWLKTCGHLEEFHADNNNMQSLGVNTSPYLHTITAKGMYGDCYFMRDAGSSSNPNCLTERGNITISGQVVTYSRTVYSTNEDGTLTGTIYYKDANGVEGGTNYYTNAVKWYDVSNSGYYIVRTANGVNLEHLDVSGNHLSELKVSGNTKLQYVDTENNDRLTYVDANDLPDLTTLKVADNPLLEKLYADNDPSLPGISGLEECTALKYLHVQNDGLLGTNNFNVQANTNLQSLLASSCNLLGELKVSQCANLDTLSVHNNQLTKLDVSSLQNMHWLNCYNNTGITELNVAASTGMTHLDLHNCSTIDLALESNTALQYFDCDNNKIRELTFAGAANIDTIHANSNNLFQINLSGPHGSLKDLQFENNHINGIDLTGCNANVLTNIQDANNGRTIPANSVTFYVKEGENQPEMRRMYYFQLVSTEDNVGGFFLNDQYCSEDAVSNAEENIFGRGENKKSLSDDGVNLDKITWNEPPFVGTRERRTRAEDLGLSADKVIGTIVVLDPTIADDGNGQASGTETYKYNNGVSQSEFYLNWTAESNAGVITELDDLAVGTLQVVGGTGCITVTAAQTTPVTVVDLSGRVVAQRDVEAGTTIIDGLQPGVYIVAGQKVVVK